MISMKFGGTSVGDIQRLKDVVRIVQTYLSMKPAIIASAMSGITDTLLDTARLSVRRETEKVRTNFETLKEKHVNVANTLVENPQRRKELTDRQSALFE